MDYGIHNFLLFCFFTLSLAVPETGPSIVIIAGVAGAVLVFIIVIIIVAVVLKRGGSKFK